MLIPAFACHYFSPGGWCHNPTLCQQHAKYLFWPRVARRVFPSAPPLPSAPQSPPPPAVPIVFRMTDRDSEGEANPILWAMLLLDLNGFSKAPLAFYCPGPGPSHLIQQQGKWICPNWQEVSLALGPIIASPGKCWTWSHLGTTISGCRGFWRAQPDGLLCGSQSLLAPQGGEL